MGETILLIVFGLAGFAVNILVMIGWFIRLENRLTQLEVKGKYQTENVNDLKSKITRIEERLA